MTEQEWLTSDDPVAMLDWLNTPAGLNGKPWSKWKPSDRKLRCWVEACRAVVAPGKRFSESTTLATQVGDWCRNNGWQQELPLSSRAHILRDIIGNPFQPVTVEERHPSRWPGREYVYRPAWLTPLVRQLAEAAYTVRTGTGTLDNDALAVLSDALEEAGLEDKSQVCPRCIDGSGVRLGLYGEPPRVKCHHCGGEGKLRFTNPILAHLREPGPHYRGCWATDILLGKE